MPELNADSTVRELVESHAATAKRDNSRRTQAHHTKTMLEFFGNFTLRELCEPYRLQNLCHDFCALKSHDAPATNRKRLGALQAALRWSWKQRVITGLPVMWLPDSTPLRDRTLSLEEREKLLAAADSYPTPPHLQTYLYLALFTDQFRHVLLDLTWDRVRFDERVMIFPGRLNPKTVARVPIHERLLPVLEKAKERKAADCEHVVQFAGRRVETAIPALKKVYRRAGLHDVMEVDLRRSRDQSEVANDAEDVQAESRLVISYCSKDGMSRAFSLCDALEDLQRKCWIAPRDVKAGAYAGHIIEAIETCDALLVVLTPMANDSPDVLQEVDAAKNARKQIIPVILGGTAPSAALKYYLASRHQIPWTDATSVARLIINMLGGEGSRRAS